MRGLNPRTPTIKDSNENVKGVNYEVFVVCGHLRTRVCAGTVDYSEVFQMSEIERIKRYRAETNIPRDAVRRYSIRTNEAGAIASLPRFEAIYAAFTYGMAKGYRAAKAEAKRG